MLALSGAAHLLMVVAAVAFPPLFPTSIRLEPVAVVDLVGGGEFARETPKPAAATAPSVPETATPPRKGRAAEKAQKKAAKSVPPPKNGKSAAEGLAPPKRQAADTASLKERLRQMREARAGSDSVREAVEERRNEAAARAAVRSVGERLAHRIAVPPTERPRASGGGYGGGAQGNVRLSPELLDYFRRLEEKVRSSWVLPESLVRDAGKLVVELRIVIEKDGRVSEARIERGSGNPYFDDSVRRAIRKASPLPVPPEQLRGGEDHYEVGFRFHGSGGTR